MDAQPGTIILLNGTAAAGKSGLAKAVQETFPEPYFLLGIDTFVLNVLPARYLGRGERGAEGVRVIRELLVCSTDDAKAVLHDLRSRKVIDVTITPGGELDTRKPMPVAQLRWVRPRT